MELVRDLSPGHQIALPRISVNDMTQDLVLAQRLAPLAALLETLSQKVTDTILQAQSECWWAAMAFPVGARAPLGRASPGSQRSMYSSGSRRALRH